jgi:microcin C transport system substrate-binding protein
MDSVQYENRVLESDFDMIIHAIANSLSPGNEQLYYFGKDYAFKTGSSNYIGCQDPNIEPLVKNIAAAPTAEAYKTSVHAFDRYVMNQYWMVPLIYDNTYRVAYWQNRFDTPPFDADIGTNVMAWGWAKSK